MSRFGSGPGTKSGLGYRVYRRGVPADQHDVEFAKPLRDFIRQDPEYALRVLTSRSCTIHPRVVEANSALLQGQIDKGLIKPPMKTQSLSYFMVRLAESCLYSDVISGREPELEELEEAFTAVRILLGDSP